jgi:hypothetical protein
MPTLDARDWHLDTFITNLLVGYRPRGLIADQLFPIVPVKHQTNAFGKIDKGAWFRIPTTLRAPNTAPREVNFTISSDNYFATNYALATGVPFEVLDNADPPFEPLQRHAEFLVDQLNLDFENRVFQRATSGVGSSLVLTGANAWADFVNSDPLTNIDVANEAIRQTTGYHANVAVIGTRAWLKLRRHPDIVRALYPGAGVGGTETLQAFAELIGVDRVLVGETIKNSAGEVWGAAGNDSTTTSFSDVWSTHFLLAYVAPAPGIMTPSFGVAFRWTGPNVGASGPGNFAIERKRDTDLGRELLRTSYYQDEKIIAPELGFLIQTGIN